jgi:hypothetical protein
MREQNTFSNKALPYVLCRRTHYQNKLGQQACYQSILFMNRFPRALSRNNPGSGISVDTFLVLFYRSSQAGACRFGARGRANHGLSLPEPRGICRSRGCRSRGTLSRSPCRRTAYPASRPASNPAACSSSAATAAACSGSTTSAPSCKSGLRLGWQLQWDWENICSRESETRDAEDEHPNPEFPINGHDSPSLVKGYLIKAAGDCREP